VAGAFFTGIHLHCISAVNSNLDGAEAIVSIGWAIGFRETWMEGKAIGNEQGS